MNWLVDPISFVLEPADGDKACPKLKHCGKYLCASFHAQCTGFTRKDPAPKRKLDNK